MKQSLIISCLTVMLYGCSTYAGNSGWLTDFDKATKAAVEKKLPVFAAFTGSDWCSWCMKLEEEILSKEEFKNYAKDNFILFVADFPMKSKPSEEIAKQNKKLAEKYNVEGFPTVLILDATGKVIAKTGYRKGGPAGYVEHLKTLVKK